MGLLTKSKPVPPSASRAALAAAIVERNRRKADLDAARATVDRCRAAIAAAEVARAAAEAALAEARARAVSAVAQDGGGQSSALRSQRQAVTDCADDLAIALEALEAAEVAAGDVRYEFDHAEKAVVREADLVLYSDIARHETTLLDLANQKFIAVSIFEFLMRLGKSQDEFRCHATLASWHNTVGGFDDPERMRRAATAPWAAAHEALMTDPETSLPV